jgi:hypothetical protein
MTNGKQRRSRESRDGERALRRFHSFSCSSRVIRTIPYHYYYVTVFVTCLFANIATKRDSFYAHAYGGGGFWQENDVLPLDVLSRSHAVCSTNANALTTVSLSDFDYRQNANGHRYVTIIGTYFTGCTPGRFDYPTLTTYLKNFYDFYETAGATSHVATVISLKNGVNAGVCDAWMTHDASSVAVNSMGGTYPLMIDDRDRSLTYSFFDAAVHPQYAVLDHCMRVAKFLPGTADQEGEESLSSVVTSLMLNITASCDEDRKASNVLKERVRAKDESFVADGIAVTSANAGDYCVDPFGPQTNRGSVKVVETGLKTPRALSFNGENEIWIATAGDDSMRLVTLDDATKTTAITSRSVTDRAKYHYLDKVSQIAFGLDGNFATCQESSNDYDGMKTPNYFMGPTLYDSGIVPTSEDINIDLNGEKCDARTNDQSIKSCFLTHEDMLHATPLCMGIAHDGESQTSYGNVFWAFDGYHNTLVRYDFEKPHGPKSLDHDLANVRRYDEVKLKREADVPSHIVVDSATRAVYIADTGNNRVIILNADSGRFAYNARSDLGGEYTSWSSQKASFEYSVFGCAQFRTFIEDLDKPSGIAIHENVLYVSEYGSGKIKAFQKTSGVLLDTFETGSMALGGIAFQPSSNKLWYVCRSSNSLRYIDVSTTAQKCSGSTGTIPSGNAIDFGTVPADGSTDLCPALPTSLGVAVHVEHDDGYLNTTMLSYSYGMTDSCMACDDDCDNDMLLMSGWLCHKCLPQPCENDGVCTNVQGKGYSCACTDGFTGDRCQSVASSSASSSSSSVSTIYIRKYLTAIGVAIVLMYVFE